MSSFSCSIKDEFVSSLKNRGKYFFSFKCFHANYLHQGNIHDRQLNTFRDQINQVFDILYKYQVISDKSYSTHFFFVSYKKSRLFEKEDYNMDVVKKPCVFYSRIKLGKSL